LIFDIPTDATADSTPAARFYRWMMRWLPERLTRDVALFHRRFIAAGLGRFLDGGAAQDLVDGARLAQGRGASGGGDATRERVEALLGPQAASSGGASPMRPRSTR
jgi:hypothetical protein